MAHDDFSRERFESDQRQQTDERREQRSRRRRLYALAAALLTIVLVLGAPTLISHSSIGRSLVRKALASYELEGEVQTFQIGWISPLRVQGLEISGAAGSQVTVDQLDADVTIADLLRSRSRELGEVSIRGVSVTCEVVDGHSNLESDLRRLLQPEKETSSATTATVKIQDVTVTVTDAVTGRTWQFAQSSAEAMLLKDRIEATFSGVLTEPEGSGGSLQGAVELVTGGQLFEPGSDALQRHWRLDLSSESLPLSVASLLRRRVRELAPYVPRTIHGDATGGVQVEAFTDGSIEASIDDLRVRNLTAADEGSRVWSNGLARISGDLVLRGERVIGHELRAATDFASATIDGAFSRTFSLVGANDNPLCWLNAIDGKATAEVDLAAFDRSLPGILPLRDDAMILSGRLNATVDSVPAGDSRSSQLSVQTDTIRARSRGAEVMVDPVVLTAQVSSNHGQLRADKFEWSSSFGSAIGHGDLRSGVADFRIDFGRLTALLRPILQISEATLAGTANGNVEWSASADATWRLAGVTDAKDLLITFPGGRSLSRPSIHGEIEAVGRWGGQTLDALNSAQVSLVSSGLDLDATLMKPVEAPGNGKPLPLRFKGTGRMETLTETIGPWLPSQIAGLTGGFEVDATAQVKRNEFQLAYASLQLIEPSLPIAGRRYSQTQIDVDFEGQYRWPDHSLVANNFTLSGNAFSMRVSGKADAKQVDVDIQWRAMLDRIQGSTIAPLASQTNRRPVQLAAFRDETVADTAPWSMRGSCEGSIIAKNQGQVIDVQIQGKATDFAWLQSPVPNVSQSPHQGGIGGGSASATPFAGGNQHVVWSEPTLTFGGNFDYDRPKAAWTSESIQLASDWFATNLQLSLEEDGGNRDVVLEGPTRLTMDRVATRLTSLLGIEIQAEGVQETPLSIRIHQDANGSSTLAAAANLGWESAEVAGIRLGPATVPVRLTEDRVIVSGSSVPVGQGFLNLAGTAFFRDGPVRVELQPGTVAESIQLTPEMTSRWLKYLAPLAADATQINGTVGAEVDEAVIVFDQPAQSRVVGRLNVGRVELNSGPLADQVRNSIRQLESIANRFQASSAPARPGKTLITIPTQTVDFSVSQGVVSHERLFFEFDRARVVTSGRVSFNGQLNMIAMVPLEEQWLGSDLKGLAGQTVTLPINGTLSRPGVDSNALAQVMSQLGAQAVQSTAENYLQQQFNRGLESLFGR